MNEHVIRSDDDTLPKIRAYPKEVVALGTFPEDGSVIRLSKDTYGMMVNGAIVEQETVAPEYLQISELFDQWEHPPKYPYAIVIEAL